MEGNYGFNDTSLTYFLDNYILHPNKTSNDGWKKKVLKPYDVNDSNTRFENLVSTQNTAYVIKYDYNLLGNFSIPNGCILIFEGGTISGGEGSLTTYTLTGSSTAIIAFPSSYIFGAYLNFGGSWYVDKVYANWFVASTNSTMFNKAFMFAELISTLDSNNYPQNGVQVTCLSKDYNIDDTITIPEGVSFDGNNARFIPLLESSSEKFMFLTGLTSTQNGRYPGNRFTEFCNVCFYNPESYKWSLLAMGDVREVHNIYAFRPQRMIVGRIESQNIYQDVVSIHNITYVPHGTISYNRTTKENALATAVISFALGECLKIAQISDGCSLYVSSKSNALIENCTNISIYNNNCLVTVNNCHFEYGDLDLLGTTVFKNCMFYHGHSISGNVNNLNIHIIEPGAESINYNLRTFKNTFRDCIFAELTRNFDNGGVSIGTERFKCMNAIGSLVFDNCFGLMSHSGSISDSPACMFKVGNFWVNPNRFEINNGLVLEDSKYFNSDIDIGLPENDTQYEGKTLGTFRMILLVDADKQLCIEESGYELDTSYDFPSVVKMFSGASSLSRFKGGILRIEAKLSNSNTWTHYIDIGIVENLGWFRISYSNEKFYFTNWTASGNWQGGLSIEDDTCEFSPINYSNNYIPVKTYCKSGKRVVITTVNNTFSDINATFNTNLYNIGDQIITNSGLIYTYVSNGWTLA